MWHVHVHRQVEAAVEARRTLEAAYHAAVRERSEDAAAHARRVKELEAALERSQLDGLGHSMPQLIQARLELDELKAEIDELRAQLREARGATERHGGVDRETLPNMERHGGVDRERRERHGSSDPNLDAPSGEGRPRGEHASAHGGESTRGSILGSTRGSTPSRRGRAQRASSPDQPPEPLGGSASQPSHRRAKHSDPGTRRHRSTSRHKGSSAAAPAHPGVAVGHRERRRQRVATIA